MAIPPPESGQTETSLDAAQANSHWSQKRHNTCGNPTPPPPWSVQATPWRYTSPGKLKTASALLILCLNLEIDPPDVLKTNPCATLECWVDPSTLTIQKASEAIGQNLQHQYESLSLKIQYKYVLDPSFEDLRKGCQMIRKQAKEDAVLFHYNGHGVPRPTASGELWCFNRNYTQYIPVSLTEVQNWLGSPGVYIWDCSAAGHLLQNFNTFAERRDNEMNLQGGGYPPGAQPFMQSLQLAACAAHEQLPTCPELPADVFTSCLTSPIEIALRYFIMNNQLPHNISADMVLQLPGDLKDRRTPLGELNWIFTAITDTIAWTTFSKETFTRLYRCDLLIASLFRNFLLAERIMKNYNCTPHTYPPLPATNTHPLWATWDLAIDSCIRQLPGMLYEAPEVKILIPKAPSKQIVVFPPPLLKPGRIGQLAPKRPNEKLNYLPNRFFTDQLTAFEVWISRGGAALTRKGPLSLPPVGNNNEELLSAVERGKDNHLVPRKPPDQLPIVLQVLLSQPHRLRALILLSQFVDLGPWAVNLVLIIGIFPYISKLLQAPGPDLRPVLIFIWARILAVDPSVQIDLYNNQQGYKYFSNILSLKRDAVLPNWSEHQAMCSFILAAMARDFTHGQQACWDERVFENCCEHLDDEDFLLRQWTALCIGQMWDSYDRGKFIAITRGTPDTLTAMLVDPAVEVRCAVLFALGTFLGASGSAKPEKQGGGGTGTMPELGERLHFKLEVSVATGAALAIYQDASPMCRKELLVVISCLVAEWRGYFVVCAWLYWEEDRHSKTWGPDEDRHEPPELTNEAVLEWLDSFGDDEQLREDNRVLLSSFFTIFVILLDLSIDPYHEVATNAQTIVDYIMALLLASPFKRLEGGSLHIRPQAYGEPGELTDTYRQNSAAPPPASPSVRPNINRADTMTSLTTGVSSTLRRTSSFAYALKNLANGIAFPSSEDGRSTPLPGYSMRARSEAGDVSRPPSPNLNFAQYESPYSTSVEQQRAQPEYNSADELRFTPFQVIDALIEEDMERLRARRQARRHHPHRSGGLPSPSNSTFSTDSSSNSIMLGIGTGLGLRDVLPLKSSFFDWCCEYFTEPQMRQTEVDEPGSIQYNYQIWRQQRNEDVDHRTRSHRVVAADYRWDRPVVSLPGSPHPLTMTFHAYDQHVIVANEHDLVTVWDWSQRKRLNVFSNGNSKGTSITSLHIMNQDTGGIILTGSSDGLIRLYRNYDPTVDQGPLQMVSAFRGLSDMVAVRQGAGVVTNWRQSSGNLLVGGDCRVIRTWHARTETAAIDIETKSDSPVTGIASLAGNSHSFAGCFANGDLKVFDGRMKDRSIVRQYTEHSAWVQNVRQHPSNSNQILSGSLDGEVKLWDLRSATSSITTWNIDSGGISAFDVHPAADVFAGASAITSSKWRAQSIAVYPIDAGQGQRLSASTLPTGLASHPSRSLPSPYIPRTSSLVFHPSELLYGVGLPDGTIRILGCKIPVE